MISREPCSFSISKSSKVSVKSSKQREKQPQAFSLPPSRFQSQCFIKMVQTKGVIGSILLMTLSKVKFQFSRECSNFQLVRIEGLVYPLIPLMKPF